MPPIRRTVAILVVGVLVVACGSSSPPMPSAVVSPTAPAAAPASIPPMAAAPSAATDSTTSEPTVSPSGSVPAALQGTWQVEDAACPWCTASFSFSDSAYSNFTTDAISGGPAAVAGDRVLVIDGDTTTADVYDPATGRFIPTGRMGSAHGTATLLQDGRVLVAGGDGAPEVYDPNTGTFGPTRAENSSASVQAATILPSGQVLLIRGGGDPSELFDPDHPQDAATAGVPPASPAPAPPDACSLLTVAEVSAIRGVPAGPGDPSASSASATDCVWPAERAGDQPLLEIAITGDDPDVWAALVASPEFVDVSSIGPTALVQGGRNGQLWVEAGKYIVHIQPTGPLPGGSPTPELQQQLKVLDALSARLR